MLLHGDRDGRRDRVLLLRGSATVHHAFPSWRVLAKLALKYHLSPRGALSELRHAAQWPLRLLYYADARGGPAHLRIVPTSGAKNRPGVAVAHRRTTGTRPSCVPAICPAAWAATLE